MSWGNPIQSETPEDWAYDNYVAESGTTIWLFGVPMVQDTTNCPASIYNGISGFVAPWNETMTMADLNNVCSNNLSFSFAFISNIAAAVWWQTQTIPTGSTAGSLEFSMSQALNISPNSLYEPSFTQYFMGFIYQSTWFPNPCRITITNANTICIYNGNYGNFATYTDYTLLGGAIIYTLTTI